MTNNLPTQTTTTIPQWSISSTSVSLSDCSPQSDDHDFFDKLLFLKPETNLHKPLVATDSDQLVSESLRGTVVNLDSEVDHPAEDISYGQRRPKTGLVSSSEPTILPSNALRLHLEEPPTPLATSHESVYARSETPIVNHHLRPSARVRFRSRVRITSGFSRHRHKSDPDDLGSSRSGSPSSSISAPLRSHADDNTNAWGTLGQRVGLLALQKKILGPSQSQRRHRPRPEPITSATQVDERTPLRGSFPRSAYVEGEGVQDGDISDEDSDDERLAREVDDIFGTLPGRLLNRHYWWWQLEPLVCCHYAAELE